MKPKNRLNNKKKTGPDIDPIIKFRLDDERDKKIQADKDRETARLIYERWKKRFINRRKHPDDLAMAVNELAAELDGVIQSDFKEWVIQEIINPIIARLHESAILEKFTVKMLVDCPGKTFKNGVESECEWGGIAAFHINSVQANKAVFQCPMCGHLCRQDQNDMMPEKEARAHYEEIKKTKLPRPSPE